MGPLSRPVRDTPGRRPPGGCCPGKGNSPLRALVDAVGPEVVLGVEAPSRRLAEQGVPAAVYAAQAMDSVLRLLSPPDGGALSSA